MSQYLSSLVRKSVIVPCFSMKSTPTKNSSEQPLTILAFIFITSPNVFYISKCHTPNTSSRIPPMPST
ncbi:hypothetical protein PI126_g9091 [Phytophthora idaei]|nr:hypothetical protein PI126_g9091 [Phytophthora idaei]